MINLNDIAELAGAYSANPSSPGAVNHPLSVDVLNALDIDLGDGLQLFGENGVLALGALGQYASSGEGEAPLASTGLINANGSIAVATGDPGENAYLDLTPLLGQAGLTDLLDQARVELGALSALATVDENGDPVGDYQIANGTLIMTSPAIAGLADTLSGSLDEVSGPINDLAGVDGAISSALAPLLTGLQDVVNTALLGVGSVDNLAVTAAVEADLQAALDSVLAEPVTDPDSAVTIDLSTGEVSVDLARLVADTQGGEYDGTLNGLPVNTEVLGPNVIQAALDGAIGTTLDQIPALVVEAVTDALNSTVLTIQITGDAVGLPPLNLPIGSLQINIQGELGGFVGADGSTPPVTDLDGTTIADIPLGQLLTPIAQYATNTLLPALVSPISGAITDEGTLDTIFRPAVEALNTLLTPLAQLITENLISLTANVQESPGDFVDENGYDEGSFTQRALQLTLLPNDPLVQLSLASATVRAGQVDTDADEYTPAYAATPATPGVAAISDPPTFTDSSGAAATAPAGTTFALATGAPADATIDADTGVITWTPGLDDASSTVEIPVVVTYPDGSTDAVDAAFVVGSVAEALTPAYTDTLAEVGVPATSDAPTFTDSLGADATAPAGTSFALDDGAPDDASIDPTTGVITWTPGAEDADSTVPIPVVVTYPDSSTDSVNALFQVGDVTAATLEPAYTDTPAHVGVPAVSDPPTFTDDGGADVEAPEGTTFTLGEGAPDDASIDPTTGVITWTPGVEDADQLVNIPVVVTYPDGSTDEVSAPFQVAALTDGLTPAYTDTPAQVGVPAVSDPPTFTDDGGAGVEAPEGTTFTLGEGAPDDASIDPTTGVITWTPGVEDSGSTVEIPVVVTYPDGSTDEVSAPFDVDVYNGNASASAAASANADDDSNASAEAAAEAAAYADATSDATAAADVDATAAAQAAAEADASTTASADVDSDANASAAAAATAAANADNSSDTNADATAAASAQTDTDASANSNSAAAADAAATADSSSAASADATADTNADDSSDAAADDSTADTSADANTNASASAAASANADDDSNAAAVAAAQAAANDDATSDASAAADVDATAAAAAAANTDASSDASADVDSDANAAAAAAAQASADADNSSATNADASAAATAQADADANAAAAAAAEAASTADSSSEASADATAEANATSAADGSDADGSGGQDLPDTGANLNPGLLVGALLLVLLGGGLAAAAKVRRRGETG